VNTVYADTVVHCNDSQMIDARIGIANMEVAHEKVVGIA
jgi:hypothetical protein